MLRERVAAVQQQGRLRYHAAPLAATRTTLLRSARLP
jgi:hypothetical protein